MAQYLLIHGAFRGAWVWEPVIACLEEDGHVARAIDLPFAGEGWTDDHPPVSLADYVEAVIDASRDMDAPVVVGHSQGGFVSGCAVGQSPESFSGLAYLDAPIPVVGRRAIDMRSPAGDALEPDFDPLADIAPIPVIAEHDLTEAQAAWINDRLTPQPIGPSLVAVGATAPPDFPTAVAFCEYSHPLAPAWGSRAQLDATGTEYVVFASHHDVAVSAPEAVASWLMGHDAW